MPTMNTDMAVWFMTPMFPKTMVFDGKVGAVVDDWLQQYVTNPLQVRLMQTGFEHVVNMWFRRKHHNLPQHLLLTSNLS